jgi:hypothetical protein
MQKGHSRQLVRDCFFKNYFARLSLLQVFALHSLSPNREVLLTLQLASSAVKSCRVDVLEFLKREFSFLQLGQSALEVSEYQLIFGLSQFIERQAMLQAGTLPYTLSLGLTLEVGLPYNRTEVLCERAVVLLGHLERNFFPEGAVHVLPEQRLVQRAYQHIVDNRLILDPLGFTLLLVLAALGPSLYWLWKHSHPYFPEHYFL